MPIIIANNKNYIINGAFDFFQRNTAATTLTTTSSYLTADRMKVKYAGIVTGTPQTLRATAVPTNSTSNYSLQFNSQRNASALSLFCSQRIESIFAKDFSGKILNGGIKVRGQVATSIRLRVLVPTAIDNYTSVTEVYNQLKTITADGNWNTVLFENISGSLVNGCEVEIELICPSGTDAGVANHYITDFFFGVGQSFVRNSISPDEELKKCQRYYEKSYEPDVAPGTNGVNAGVLLAPRAETVTANREVFHHRFLITKRAIPVIANYSLLGAINNVFQYNGSGSNISYNINSGIAISTFGFNAAFNIAAVTTGGVEAVCFHYTADAEL